MSELEEYIKTIKRRRYEKGADPERRHCGDCVHYTTCKIIVDTYAIACGNFESVLKPCPFCGGEVSISYHGEKHRGYWWSINRGINKKTKCRCRLFFESKMFDENDEERKKEEYRKLIISWNTRQ